MNPVVGLFAVGLLGRIRTRRHRRRRREVGVSSWSDFEAPFPPGAPVAGEPRQAREQQKLRPAGFPLTTPNPTLPAPSFLPENSVGRTQAMPTPWGLGPGPAEAEAARGRAVEGAFIPGALGAGVGSRARLFPTLGAPHKPFLEHNLRTGSRGSPRTGSGSETPRTRVRSAWHGRRSAPPGRLGLLPRRARGRGAASTYFFLLHEAHEGGPLDLHGLALPVVEGQDEVEEVGFPQVGRRLLLKVSPGQTHPAAAKEAELDGCTGHPPATPGSPAPTGLLCPANAPRGAPSTQAPRAHPTAGLACSRASCPPRGSQGAPPPTNSQKRCESFVRVLRRW